MACVFPLSSRESVTFRCTGCATVTFGGGGPLWPRLFFTARQHHQERGHHDPGRRGSEASSFHSATNPEAGGRTSVHATPADCRWTASASRPSSCVAASPP